MKFKNMKSPNSVNHIMRHVLGNTCLKVTYDRVGMALSSIWLWYGLGVWES